MSPSCYLARDQNLPLVSIAAIVQRPLTSIISVGKHKITRVAQLRGKTVGDAGIAYQHAYLDTILRHAGVPVSSVKEINVGDNLVPAMLSKRVTATLGGFWNYEAIQLAQLQQAPECDPGRHGRGARLRRARPGGEARNAGQAGRRDPPLRAGAGPRVRVGTRPTRRPP